MVSDLSLLFLVIIGLIAVVILSLLSDVDLNIDISLPYNLTDKAPRGSYTSMAPEGRRRTTVLLNILPVFILVLYWSVAGSRSAIGFLTLYLFWVIGWTIEEIDPSGPLAVIDGMGSRGITIWHILVGAGIGISAFFASEFFGFLAIDYTVLSIGNGKIYSTILTSLVLMMSIPASEEGFFRGIWLPTISERWGSLFGLISTSLAFGIAHLVLPMYGYQLGTLIFTTFLGLIFGITALVTGSLSTALTAHSTFNMMGVVFAGGILAFSTVILYLLFLVMVFMMFRRGGL